MKHYAIMAINKATGDVEHVSTSDKEFTINPFIDMAEDYTFEEYEFINAENSPRFIRARELLDNLNIKTKEMKASVSKFSEFKLKTK